MPRISNLQPCDSGFSYRKDIIQWVETPEIPISALDVTPEISIQITRRTMFIRQLPSGFWAWMPNHPDDLAIVAEHKRESNKNFGVTQLLTVERIVVSEGDDRYLQSAREDAKRKLAVALISNIQEGKIYRTAYIERIGKISHYGRIVDKISACFLYAEEVYGDTPLQHHDV